MTLSNDALSALSNRDGELHTPMLFGGLTRPARVELLSSPSRSLSDLGKFSRVLYGSELRFWYPATATQNHSRRVSKNILERFFSLRSRSDEQIYKFASQFGGLRVFEQYTGREKNGSELIYHEYCAVWRYLAGAMSAIAKLCAASQGGMRGELDDWSVVGDVPGFIQDQSGKLESEDFFEGREKKWLVLAHFIRKGEKNWNRYMLVHLLNTLLELGSVKAEVLWPNKPKASRPQITYAQTSLLSYLALQLCLLAARIDSFVLCFHCHKQYLPGLLATGERGRAPKTGQRGFCPECRRTGVPKMYATRDHRARKRESRT